MPAASADPHRAHPSLAQLLPFVHSGGGLWITNLFHYPALLITWASARAGVSPNALTLASALLTVGVGIVLFTAPVTGCLLAAGGLFAAAALAYMLDCADGQLARSTGQGSKLGAWLDHTLDAVKIVLLNAGYGWVGIRLEGPDAPPMAIPFLAMVLGILGNVTYFFGWNYKVMLAGKGKAAAEIRSGTLKRLMLLPLHLTDFAIFLLLLLLLPWPTAFVWAFFGFSVITFPIYGAYLAVSAFALRRA